MDDLFTVEDTQSRQAEHQAMPSRRQLRERQQRPRKKSRGRKFLSFFVMLISLGLIGAAGWFVWTNVLEPMFADEPSQNTSISDYPGPGHGQTQLIIESNDTGSAIAQKAVEAGVIASTGPFISAYDAHPEAMGIQPGVYDLSLEMKASDALNALLDPENRSTSNILIVEGLTVEQTFAEIARYTSIPVDEIEAAAENTSAIGLPEQAEGDLEGWLYPATYNYTPGMSAEQILNTMVSRTITELENLGVAAEDQREVLTKASLVEAEGRDTDTRRRIATVIENRIAPDSGYTRLEFDSTVKYLTGKDGSVYTSDEDRAIDDPYNTYRHPGLPPGPIGTPSLDSIQAVLNPEPGDWLFFVTVNLDTGETLFAETFPDHLDNVEVLREWERERAGNSADEEN